MASKHPRGSFATLLLLVVVGLVGSACAEGPGPQGEANEDLKPVTFRLDFGFTGYHAPFFLAAERGYYADAGLRVEMLAGTGSGDTVKLVGSGNQMFGFVSLTVMALAVAKDEVPVKALAGVIQKVPDAIFSRADRNITQPKDLEGKTWGATPGSSGETAFPAFADKTGINVDAIRRVNIPIAAKLPAMVNGRVDWMTNFSFTKAPELDKQGVKYNMILYSDYLDILGHGLITRPETISSDPETVKGFMAASMRGLEEGLADPAAAVAAMTKAHPELRSQTDVLTQQVTRMREFVRTPRSQGKALGWQAPEDWQATTSFIHEYLDAPEVDPTSLYTNEFVES